MDLFGLIDPISLSGWKYILVVIYDYTRYTWTLFLRKKNKTGRLSSELLKQLQNEKGTSIAKIRSYQGTEFVNQVIQGFYG